MKCYLPAVNLGRARVAVGSLTGDATSAGAVREHIETQIELVGGAEGDMPARDTDVALQRRTYQAPGPTPKCRLSNASRLP